MPSWLLMLNVDVDISSALRLGSCTEAAGDKGVCIGATLGEALEITGCGCPILHPNGRGLRAAFIFGGCGRTILFNPVGRG
jgi:hypothetical protein